MRSVRAAVCPFDSMAGAANTVIQTIQLGIPVARIEIIDEVQLRVVNAYSKTNYPLAPTLFFEFHGISETAVEDQIRAVEEITRENGGRGFKWASSLEDRNTLWQARHNAYYAAVAYRFRILPSAFSRRRRTCSSRMSKPRSSDMPVTATFT